LVLFGVKKSIAVLETGVLVSDPLAVEGRCLTLLAEYGPSEKM
jgi:hypothetical protein